MKKISMLIAVAATYVGSMQAIFFVTGQNGNLILYASCETVLSHPEIFDTSSDRFYREYEACHEASTFPGLHEYHADLVQEEKDKLVNKNAQLSQHDQEKLSQLVYKRVLCRCAGSYGAMATNSICTENEKKLQDFLSAVNDTNSTETENDTNG